MATTRKTATVKLTYAQWSTRKDSFFHARMKLGNYLFHIDSQKAFKLAAFGKHIDMKSFLVSEFEDTGIGYVSLNGLKKTAEYFNLAGASMAQVDGIKQWGNAQIGRTHVTPDNLKQVLSDVDAMKQSAFKAKYPAKGESGQGRKASESGGNGSGSKADPTTSDSKPESVVRTHLKDIDIKDIFNLNLKVQKTDNLLWLQAQLNGLIGSRADAEKRLADAAKPVTPKVLGRVSASKKVKAQAAAAKKSAKLAA